LENDAPRVDEVKSLMVWPAAPPGICPTIIRLSAVTGRFSLNALVPPALEIKSPPPLSSNLARLTAL